MPHAWLVLNMWSRRGQGPTHGKIGYAVKIISKELDVQLNMKSFVPHPTLVGEGDFEIACDHMCVEPSVRIDISATTGKIGFIFRNMSLEIGSRA